MFFLFFKQKTAYEMRISDWSSDVCSSDLPLVPADGRKNRKTLEGQSLMLLVDSGVGLGGSWDGTSQAGVLQLEALLAQLPLGLAMTDRDGRFQIGRASCRERVCPYV